MTFLRAALLSAMIACLSFAYRANAQIAFPLTVPTSRVDVPLSALSGAPVRIVGNMNSAYPICEAGAAHLSPDNLKTRLAAKIGTVSPVDAARRLIAQVEGESGPQQRFALMFPPLISEADLSPQTQSSGPRAFQWLAIVGGAGDVARPRLLAGVEYVAPNTAACFTASQVDQINAEGLRVLRAIAGQGGAPTQAPQQSVKPGAAPQPLSR